MAVPVVDPSTADHSAEQSNPEDPSYYPAHHGLERRSMMTHHAKNDEHDACEEGCCTDDSSDDIQKPLVLATHSPRVAVKKELPKSAKLLLGAGGIYAAYLYQGSLQEDVFEFVDEEGQKFEQAWFLETLESFTILLFGFFGLLLYGEIKDLPYTMFCLAGSAQVCAKVCSNIALAAGLSYHIMVLGKSCKMLPVMLGSLAMGGASYKFRQYAQVIIIVAGTCICLLSRENPSHSEPEILPSTDSEDSLFEMDFQVQGAYMNGARADTIEEKSSSQTGIFYICLSLVFDGLVAGFQKRLQSVAETKGVNPSTCDFMFWTSLPMVAISGTVAMLNGEFESGLAFCVKNPIIQGKIFRFSILSAFGQIAVFYVLAEFSPLVVSTVTTTRKIFSVLLSLTLKGHSIAWQGWAGVLLAFSGILSELEAKRRGRIAILDKAHGSFSSKMGY